MCNQVYAQERTSPSKARYIVEVDSQIIKATPYEITFENGKEIHHDKNVEWYTDMKIHRFISKEIDENGIILKSSSSLKPTIFLLSGGGFTKLDNQAELKPGDSRLHDNVKLAKKLTNGGLYNVIWIDYEIETFSDYKKKIDSLFLIPNGPCYLNNTEAKARIEHASLKAFKDLRNELIIEINKTSNYVDPNNVFISGISAGAILTIYSVFLDQSEIPTNLSFINCNGSTTSIDTELLATGGFPIPAIKGIIPMAGGSFYNNIFNNTTHSNNTFVNFMHGTCDEIINQNQNIVSYKFYNSGFTYNSYDANRYPTIYGSNYIYNQLISNHSKVGFGQIINGGHSVLNLKITDDLFKIGGWDIIDVLYGTPPFPPPSPNMSLPINQRNIVFDNIITFINRAMGISGFPTWTNHSYSLFPDIPTSGCLTDDLTLINTPITASNVTCVNQTASISNVPSWATITWNASSNIQIVGSNIGTSITYKGVSNGSGTLTASISYGLSQPTVTINKNINISGFIPTPHPTTIGYDTLCMTGSKTLTITNLPAVYSSITWTASSGLSIISQSGPTVTYQRSGPLGGGTLTATIVNPCETKSFTFPIRVYRNLSGTYPNVMGINYACGPYIFSSSEPPVKLPLNTTATFSVTYTNANFNDITGAEWAFSCGTITSGPTNTWIGNDLKSQITVQASNNPLATCGDVRVRPINMCSTGTDWRIQDTELSACGSSWLIMTSPNPTSGDLYISLSYGGERIEAQKFPLEIVDIIGNKVLNSSIENGSLRLDVGNLQPGHYKIIINTGREIITSSFIVNK